LRGAGTRHFLRRMEQERRPVSPPCLRCGEQPEFVESTPSPSAERVFHMFECQCGEKTWISEKPGLRRNQAG
jgi:hypothetical protein